MHGKYEQRKPKKKSSFGKVLLIVLAVLLLLAALAAAAGYFYLRSKMNKVNYVQMPPKTTYATEAPAETTAEATEEEETQAQETAAETTEETTVETTVPPMKPEDIINVLVVGQSARAGEEARLADTMILVSMNTYTKTVTLTSILRDTWADFPPYAGHGAGRNKITNAYALGYAWTGDIAGSMDMMNQVLKLNFGVEVDYNVEIDFDQFIKIIDYLGGVRIELTEAEANYLNKDKVWVKSEVHEGENRLDGMTALCYARMRKAEGDSESDIKRSDRQRKVITALINKLKGRSISEMNSMIDTVLPFITTNMDPDTMTKLILKCLPLVTDLKVESGTCPYDCWGEMIDIYGDGIKHSVLKFDRADNTRHMRAIAEGDIAE